MTWFYNNEIFTEEDIDSYVGFVYLITELSTGMQYIGQKVFYNKISKRPLKGKKNRRISRKQSDWQDYFGSNEHLNLRVEELGTENYHREILHLCRAKSEMNYYENYEIYVRHALLQPDKFYNSWASCRVNRNQLKSLIIEYKE